LYHYQSIEPFTEAQLDTKHLLDKRALPPEVYKPLLLWLRAHGVHTTLRIRLDIHTKCPFASQSA